MTSSLNVLRLLLFISFCCSNVDANFYKDFIRDFYKDWLNHEQYKCVGNVANLAEIWRTYYLCVRIATIQCIRDDYVSSHSISRESPQHFDYFCGYISGINLREKSTHWSIISPTRHPIRLIFFKFSLHHRKYRCVLEKLVITTKIRHDEFCGRRREPWYADYFESELHISFYSQFPAFRFEYFKLQYHRTNYVFFATNFVLSSSPNMRLIELDSARCCSFHFIAPSKFQTVQVTLDSLCRGHMDCYDGPSQIASNVIANEQIYTATSYQMICFVFIKSKTCWSGVKYRFQNAVLTERNYKSEDEFLPGRNYKLPESVKWGIIADNYKRHEKFNVTYTGWDDDQDLLLEGQACIYGGLFAYEITEEAPICVKCLLDKYYETNCPTCNMEDDKINNCAVCLHTASPATCIPCIYLRQVWAHCSAETGKFVLFDNLPVLLLQTYNKQYSGGISSLEIHGLWDSVRSFCVEEKSAGIKKALNMVLNTSDPEFYFFLQPCHKSEIIYKKYIYRFTDPRSILFTFFPNSQEEEEGCVYCILNYTNLSNIVFTDLKRIDNTDVESMESPVIAISVHLEDCKQLVYIAWELIIKSARQAHYPSTNYVQMNQTFVLPPYADHSHHQLRISIENPLDYWWYMIYVQNLNKGIWKLSQEFPCQVNRVGLELISESGSSSHLYSWGQLSQPNLTTWITGCTRCVIIYVASEPHIHVKDVIVNL